MARDLRAVIGNYQHLVMAAVSRLHGTIARFVGDGVLAYFGWPNADEVHAESAVRAGLTIVKAIASQKLAVRVGIATGLVVVGDLVGATPAQKLEAVGETPNLAARLQSLAEPNTIVVSDATRTLLGGMFDVDDIGAMDLKGFGAPQRAWRVRRETALSSRSEALYAGALTPLIGRDEEIDLLLRRWRRAKSGEGQLVLLSGEPGIGKSRLIAELEQRLTTEPHANMRYFCSPHHQDSPLRPIIARWEQEAGFSRADSPPEQLTKLEAILVPSELSPMDVALLADMLSVPTEGRYPRLELSPQLRKERTFAVLIRRLAAIARTQPVLMLFEDAHWADPTSLELFAALIDQLGELPVLLVVSFRPGFVAPWMVHGGMSVVMLNRLDQLQSAALVAQVTATHVLPPALLGRIVAQADGVPLFIEELTKAVLEGAGQRETSASASVVPATLQASLMARLERLPAAKQVAQIGAVIGREFSHILLIAVAGLSEAELTNGLDELLAAELVFRRRLPPEAIYTFKHALVQEIAYESLLRARRQTIHQLIAETIRDQLPERANAEPEIVAHHFTQGGMPAPAVEWWGRAGDLALGRSAYAEAIADLERALQLAQDCGDGPDQRRIRLRLQTTYGNALRMARGFGVAETQAAFAVACDLAAAIEDVAERFPACYGLWSGSLLRGDLRPMQDMAATLLRDAENLPKSPEASIAQRICGMTRWFEGNFVGARRHLEQALAIYEAVRDREVDFRFGQDVASPAMAYLALALWALGVPDRAKALVEAMVTHALATRHVPTIAYAYGHAAIFEVIGRNRRRAAPHVEALHGVAREHGIPVWIGNAMFHEGWLQSGAMDREAGMAAMHEGLALMRLQQQEIFMPLLMTVLAETEAEAGRPDAALATVDGQLATIERTGQRWCLADLHRVRGEILLKCRPCDAAAAESAFRRAIDIARSQAAKLFELQAALSLAGLWVGQGKFSAARELLVPICAWFGEDDGCAALRDARAMLDDL